MGRIHHEYHIDAPPEVAWAVGRDPDRMPEWNTTTVSVKDVSGPLDRQGATYTTVSKIVGRPLEVQWQVEQVDPGRMAEVTASSPRGGSARVIVRYEPDGSGTKLSTDLDYELPMGFLGDVADKLFGGASDDPGRAPFGRELQGARRRGGDGPNRIRLKSHLQPRPSQSAAELGGAQGHAALCRKIGSIPPTRSYTTPPARRPVPASGSWAQRCASGAVCRPHRPALEAWHRASKSL